jgi:ATP-dependent helicase HrpA
MLRDQHRLRRRIDGAGKARDAADRRARADEVAAELAAAERRVAGRRAAVPKITYPPELPITARRDDIAAAISDHQVVIVAGETGSGKTTQLPKICLELGRGVLGAIGHTQPRRIAARTVAERIAEELGTPLGAAVGYKVRFTDRAGGDTLVKVMTDGILLTEIQRDRMLRQYDTLIIDEAHERSLNIDFILGYLERLLPSRPDLKVIITSATIDPERFARHFAAPAEAGGPRAGPPDGETGRAAGAPAAAPIVEVSGRTYPVEVRYRPVIDPDDPDADPDRDQIQAICEAVDELCAEGPGDVLVFLSGEREIRDTADALGKRLAATGRAAGSGPAEVDVLPLYARLSAAEQHRVFRPHRGRRVVLATNVAETSLTVPGIKYVVDTGLARISRYSHRLKVQRLPIEPVSRASAEQRKGRCGRTSDGICVRLYTEADYLERPEFTDPEILRTSLAAVILQMTALGLGEIADFPFLDPPDRRQVTAGIQLLEELGALAGPRSGSGRRGGRRGDGGAGLTEVGRKLAQMPIDPRFARMMLEADRNGCAREVTIIVAALSIQDPRERPAEAREAAAQRHARFADRETGSDFLAFLNLWDYLRERQRELSGNQFRRLCRAEYLNYLRVREWQDLVGQLRQVARGLGITMSGEGRGEARDQRPEEPGKGPGKGPGEARGNTRGIHVSLLAGLLSHIGLRDPERRDYLGARGARFAIFPGSALFRAQPRWVMAAELVETSRLWGRTIAKIDPEWVEPLATHLVKRAYSEPHWEKRQGAVMATERVTLYGIPIVSARKVNYGRIDPETARELFIRRALVEGDWDTRHRFFHRNRALVAEVEELEHRVRRRDILVDDETLHEFYDRRLPADVVSARHFDSWWRRARRQQPDLLTFDRTMLVSEHARQAERAGHSDFPDVWLRGELGLALSYQFEPGADADGVTVHIPLPVLNQVTGGAADGFGAAAGGFGAGAGGFDWQVPGLREELVTELIRSLPKPIRRNLVPVPDHARRVLARMTPYERPLLEELGEQLQAMTGVPIPYDAWDPERVPEHLKMTFRVTGADGRTLREGKDLAALARELAPQVRATLSERAGPEGIERAGIRDWDFGTLDQVVTRGRLKGYPALVDEGDSVAIRVLAGPAEQRRAMWLGTRRLLLLNVASPARSILRGLSNQAKLALSHSPHGSAAKLFEDCVACAADHLIAEAGGPAWDERAYGRLFDHVRAGLYDNTEAVVATVERIMEVSHPLHKRLAGTRSPSVLPSLTDVKAQLDTLIYPGFVAATGRRRLPDVLRYVRAAAHRLDKLSDNPGRDRDLMLTVQRVERAYREWLERLPPGRRAAPEARQIRWMIEELRVSLFAQTLGTAYPVSEQRIRKAMDRLGGGSR